MLKRCDIDAVWELHAPGDGLLTCQASRTAELLAGKSINEPYILGQMSGFKTTLLKE